MSKRFNTISINNLLNFQEIKQITMKALNISSSDFDKKYYKLPPIVKTTGLKGHSARGKGSSGRKYATPSLNPLYQTWYSKRDTNWLYSHKEYFWDGLACSWETSAPNAARNVAHELLYPHTNKYIKSHPHRKFKYINPIDTFNLEWNIFDWGSGVGLTTILISQNFPKSKIYYEATPCSSEFKFFKEAISFLTNKGFDLSNIHIVSSIDDIPDLDYMVGIEIVEHFKNPMPVLEKYLNKIKAGGIFAHSSFWESEKNMPTLGHFTEYEFDEFKGYLYNKSNLFNYTFGKPSINTAWKKAMRKRNWILTKRDPFGHKPRFWIKKEDTVGLLYKVCK